MALSKAWASDLKRSFLSRLNLTVPMGLASAVGWAYPVEHMQRLGGAHDQSEADLLESAEDHQHAGLFQGQGDGLSAALDDVADLIAALPKAQVRGDTDVSIETITCDSRQVVPGSLFVAYRGVALDGHDFIPGAVSNGAVAVVAERSFSRMRRSI